MRWPPWFRLRRLRFCEPTGMGALALGPWKAGGSRTVDDWRPGENLSSSSAGAGTQPIFVQGPCVLKDSNRRIELSN